MGWEDNPDLTEPSTEDFDRPLMGVTGGGNARPGDTYTLTFEGDGDVVEVETPDGAEDRVAVDATVEEVNFPATTGDGVRIEEGDQVRLMTGSKRFLAALKQYAPIGGRTIRVEVEDTGFDAAYHLEEVA